MDAFLLFEPIKCCFVSPAPSPAFYVWQIESDFEPVTPNTEAARKAELTKMYPDEVKKVVGKTAEGTRL